MWIKTTVLISCIVIALATAEKKSSRKEDRGKRNLEYRISHQYQPERRISTGTFSFHNPSFFPGPRPYSSTFHSGRQNFLPPYAVQMEPLVQYSKKDPLYDINIFSLHTDDLHDLSADTNHINEHVYDAPKHQIIERPVYIKEPEPIIEIIIKESNVTLPPPPTTPPPKKKKEEVQVFYVKYKKNPNGHGKESVIYDKPIPAISPTIHEDDDKEETETHYEAREIVTPPPPSTTLRTIIKPDSETYHSPSGIKVTFGKESFDYSKRQINKERIPEEEAPNAKPPIHYPQGRQLGHFAGFQKRDPGPYYNFQPNSNSYRPEPRPPQPYIPFTSPPSHIKQPPVNFRPNSPPHFFPQSKPQLQIPSNAKLQNSQFGAPFPRPPSGEFSSGPPNTNPYVQRPPSEHPPRHAVPYRPFEQLIENTTPRSPPQYNSVPFISPQQPSSQPKLTGQRQEFHQHQIQQNQQQYHHLVQQNQPQPVQQQQSYLQYRPSQPVIQQTQQFNPVPQSPQGHFRPETYFPTQQKLPLVQQSNNFNPLQPANVPSQIQQSFNKPQFGTNQPPLESTGSNVGNEHLLNLQHAQNILPPGGELIQSLPKYEQHFSVIEPGNSQQPQTLALQQSPRTSVNNNNNQIKNSQQEQFHISSSQNFQQPSLNAQYQQQSIRNAYVTQKSIVNTQTTKYQSSTPRLVYKSTTQPTTTTTTSTESVTPSTTTKDPKVLEAQLPDEVPEDLRAQLLSSGILNNADISVLDYDKVGDIPLSALPPDQLANFYNAGGGAQIGAESEPIPSVLKTDGTNVDLESLASETTEVKAKPDVEMKVVRYNPATDQGQKIEEAYIKDHNAHVDPVVLNDNSYNRYLPIKVNGSHFPIPDVPELKNKKISSVVILAPISYDFSTKRKTRGTDVKNNEEIDLVQGDLLKTLLQNPTMSNYKKFLDNQKRTKTEEQAVILLVAGNSSEKEIFMYDISSQTVSKLNGDLSSAFVEAAEANAAKEKEAKKLK